MKREDVETAVANRFREILVDLLGVRHDQITLTSRFREDLDADSLDVVELVMAVEDEFNQEIDDADAQKIMIEAGTVGDLVTYIVDKINE